MADGSFFNGTFTRRPGVRAAVQANGSVPLGNDPRIIVLIGQAQGGQPQQIMQFATPQDAVPVLRGGDLLTALFRAFNPGDSGGGPATIFASRVNPATKATLTLNDANGHPSVLFTSVNWGLLDNLNSIAVAAGSTSGKKLTISNTPLTYALDNLGRVSFTLVAAGAGMSAAKLFIYGTTLKTTITGGTVAGLNINLATYPTLQQLVAYINSITGYTATMVYTNPNEPTTQLDSASALIAQYDGQYNADIFAGAVNVTANDQAIVDAVNAGTQGLVTAQRAHGITVTDGAMTASSAVLTSATAAFVAGDVGRQVTVAGAGAAGVDLVTTIAAFTNGTTVTLATAASTTVGPTASVTIQGGMFVPTNVGSTYLTGGVEGSFSNSDWTTCFGLYDNSEVSYITPLTGDASVHALLKNSVETLSASGQNPRRAVVGGILGEYSSTLTNYLSRAAALNSRRVSLIPTGLRDNDDITGLVTLYPPFILAAQIAGLMATTPQIGDAVTHQEVRGLSLEWTPTAGNLETLLAGGLLPLEFVAKGAFIRVTRGLTTWLQDNSLINTEMACVEDIDVLIADGYVALDPLVGKKGSPTYIGLVASAVQSWLMDEETAGIIVGDPVNGVPAFRNITVKVLADVTTVNFQASIGAPQNFINLTASLNTFAGSLSIATAS